MKVKRSTFAGALSAALALFLPTCANATLIPFFIDTTGTETGLTGLAPTAANVGQYAAGSFLAISGNASTSISGLTTSPSGSFVAQQAASGSFSTGNPGSLLSFYGGTLWVNVDFANNTISFPGGNDIYAQLYDAKYPEVAHAAVPLSPGVNGGVSGTPGSAPADYGVNMKMTTSFLNITVLNGTFALRDTVLDINQIVPGSTIPLSGPAGNQTFNLNGNVQTGITSGNLDANLKGTVLLSTTVPDVIGSFPLGGAGFAPNQTATPGTLTHTATSYGSVMMITIPIQATIIETITGDTPITATITLTGQIAAFGPAPVPEPTAFALATIAGLALVPYAWRRRKRCAESTRPR